MTYAELKQQAEDRWQVAMADFRSMGPMGIEAQIQACARHIRAGNIQTASLEVTGASVALVPKPLQVISPTFVPRAPQTILERLGAWLFRGEYDAIRKAEQELKELNAAFTEHLERKYTPEQIQNMVRAKLGGFKRGGEMVRG